MSTNFNRNILFSIILLMLFSSLISKEINPRVSFLKSAILPGWGELSLGNKSGYIFLTTELIFWSSRLYYLEEADLKEKASYTYALKYAHINPGNYSDEYFFHLSRYESSGYETGGYNAYIVELAKNKFPDDPEAQTEYINANIYSDEYFWQWDDKDNKHEYSILRKRITQYTDYAKAFMGAIIANHIISAINSARISSKLKRLNVNVHFDCNLNPMLSIGYNF